MITLKTLASLIAGGTMLVGAPVSYAASQHANGGADSRAEVTVEAGAPDVPQPEVPAAPAAPAVPQAPKAPQMPKAPKAPEAPAVPKAPEVPTADVPAASAPQGSVSAGGGSATVNLPSASVGLGN